MDRRRIEQRLRHMLEAVVAIERLAAAKSIESYRADPDLAAAVERYLERLPEASRSIPEAMKGQHPHIDWRGVADNGNVLRHAYDQISDRRVLQVVTDDLPPLKAAIKAMIAEIGRGEKAETAV